MAQLLSGKELEEKAKRLGVDPNERIYASSSGSRKVDDAELQRRVIEAERHNREINLWWIALISAIASVVSAITAWYAIMYK